MGLGRAATIAALVALAVGASARPSAADEGGVGFWVPGTFGSFTATPVEPGFSLPIIYYHVNGDVGTNKDFVIGGSIVAGMEATGDLLFVYPTYTFQGSHRGGQAALAIGAAFGKMNVDAAATLTGPKGAVITGKRSDDVTGITDLYPQATLRWNKGSSNYLLYLMAGIPTGNYEKGRLANLGLNHWSVDAGGGFTFLNPGSGQELSAALGFTYNFVNPATDYRNGTDMHLDYAVTQFLTKVAHLGIAGYFYNQLGGDSGSGAVLGDFKSQTTGLGPLVGTFFEPGDKRAYAEAKAYWEFASKNRPEGWNFWLTVALPL